MFYPLVKRGTYVEQGMKVGYVTDYLGKVIFEARAPVAGVVLYVCAVPSMTKGATIANVGWSRSGRSSDSGHRKDSVSLFLAPQEMEKKDSIEIATITIEHVDANSQLL